MIRMLVLLLAALSSHSHAEEPDKLVQNTHVERSDAKYHPVKSGTSTFYGTGVIFGKVGGIASDVGLFKANQIQLILGQYPNDPNFTGNPLNVTTTNPTLLHEISKLDPTQNYLFKFNTAYPMHMYSSRTLLTEVQPVTEPEGFLNSKLPTELNVSGGRRGHIKLDTMKGRLVRVERWNTYFTQRPICSFTLDTGGSHATGNGDIPNQEVFNIYSEDGCRYVESILPFGLDLRITFTETAPITLDWYRLTAHSILVDHIPGSTVSGNGQPSATQEMMNDPEFQAAMQKLVDDYWKKTHAP